MKRRDVLHHVRSLRALVNREPHLCGVPVGYHGARLQGHASMPSKDEIGLHDLVGAGKRRVDRAGVEVALEGKVVAQ